MTNRLVSVDSVTYLFPPTVMGAVGDVFQYGRAVSVNPSMSQATIQTILNGVAAGTRVAFAPGTYTLAGPLTVAADNTFIDALTATFVQTTWQVPGFDAIGRSGCLFDIGMVQWSGSRGGVGTSYRGSAGYCSGAGVWINRDKNYVRNLKTSGMPVGVFLSSWDGSTANDRVGVGNRLGKIEVDNYNFGVLYAAQDGLVIEDIYGHDDLDDSAGANPTHVIYGSAVTAFRAARGHFKSIRAKNNLAGQPVQVKFHDGLRVDYMSGTNSMGLLNVMDSNDLSVGAYTSLGTLANGGNGAITFQRSVTNSQKPRFGPGFIQMAANVDERAVNIISDSGDFDRIMVESNHSVSVSTAIGEIIIRGTGNRLRRPTMISLGAGAIPAIINGFSAETANNTIITDLVVQGTLNGVALLSSSTGVKVTYDPLLQSFTGASFFDTTSGNVSTSAATQVTLSTFGENAALAHLAAATPTVGAANSALQVRVTPKRDIAVSSLIWWSASASGNYDIGIFDDASNAKIWTKGSTAWPAAGKITETVTSVTLLGGKTYRIAFAADNATGTFRGLQAPVTGMDLQLSGVSQTTTVSTAFPLPTSTLAGGTSGNNTRLPLIIVGGV